MAVKVLEVFSDNLPSFLTNNTDVADALNRRGIDLANATYTRDTPPRSGRDPKISDPNRKSVYRLKDGQVYIPGIYDPYVRINNDSNYVYASKLSGKNLLSFTDEYGYIDATDPSNFKTDKQRQRAAARSGSVDRGLGQYKDPSGNWRTARGQDKSGYKLPSPTKYSDMLYDVGLDTYADRLDYFYKRLVGIRDRLVSLMSNVDIKSPSSIKGTYYSNDALDIIGSISRSLSQAANSYRKLVENIEKLIEEYNSGNYNDYEGRYPIDKSIQSAFKWSDLSRSIQDLSKEMKGLEAK